MSSTFIDLRQVRSDIEMFLRDVGYEPVLFERAAIPYSHTDPLEDSAYGEVTRCDIVVAIIGGRFGTTAGDASGSITQTEIETAINANKPVFFFVEQGTLSEYNTWRKNIDVEGMSFAYADDKRIFEFIGRIYGLKKNNPVFGFSYASEIATILKDQFAGLFQDLLGKRTTAPAVDMIEQLRKLANDLENLVKGIAGQSVSGERDIKEFLIVHHPMFGRLADLLRNKYRVFFTNISEMESWLAAKGFSEIELWDDETYRLYDMTNKTTSKSYVLYIAKDLFDAQKNLKVVGWSDWNESSIKLETRTPSKSSKKVSVDDDIPF